MCDEERVFIATSERAVTEDERGGEPLWTLEPHDGSASCRRYRKSMHLIVETINCDDITAEILERVDVTS